ncbi:sigma-54-dependent transcriptional regulator [Sporosarcina obsidiansis]|uniref:sigma-54-dependent transcriptional regulator n=1 Tax=Sporosarcina obsidiansis TaxID=2660748 RepID=UPI00129ADC55|nr:sigma-54 dependent transcriptional regulator [Sporosarcina obsidiansis]
MTHLLIVEDEIELARFLTRLFSLKGFSVSHLKNGAEFDQLGDVSKFDLAFLDVRLPDRNGLDVLQVMKTKAPNCPCIVMTGYSTVKLAVDAIRFGAVDFIEKPFEDIGELEQIADRYLQFTELPSTSEYSQLADNLGIYLGQSEDMHDLYQLAYKIANKQVNILIEGETGTGKEMLTKFIHTASHRTAGPLIGVNCGALSETLLESELFGHSKGSFTGAVADRVGYFEAASSGTLFLDEIAEASPSTQVKLLRVLETGEFTKIGGTRAQKTEARVISASHANLEEAVKKGTFREDLLYRLDIVKLVIPPLRERKEDIPYLVERLRKQIDETIVISDEALAIMQHYDWPGNMRELANTIRHMGAISSEGSIITATHLPAKLTSSQISLSPEQQSLEFIDEWRIFSKKVTHVCKGKTEFELEELLANMRTMEKKLAKTIIENTLTETIGNRKKAAKKLGITDRKIRYYLNEV